MRMRRGRSNRSPARWPLSLSDSFSLWVCVCVCWWLPDIYGAQAVFAGRGRSEKMEEGGVKAVGREELGERRQRSGQGIRYRRYRLLFLRTSLILTGDLRLRAAELSSSSSGLPRSLSPIFYGSGCSLTV